MPTTGICSGTEGACILLDCAFVMRRIPLSNVLSSYKEFWDYPRRIPVFPWESQLRSVKVTRK